MIKISNLYVKRDKYCNYLHNINLNIQKGEKILIQFDDEDSPKRLFRCILNLYEAFDGEITINGKINKKINKEKDLSIAYLFKDSPVLEKKSVFKNLAYVLKIRKEKKETISQKVEEILEKYEILELKNILLKDLPVEKRELISAIRLELRKIDLLIVDNIFIEEKSAIEKVIKNIMNENKEMTVLIASNINLDIQFDKILKFQNGSLLNC